MKKLVLFGVVLSLAFGTRAQGNDDSYTFEYETLPSGDVRISHNLKPSLTERGIGRKEQYLMLFISRISMSHKDEPSSMPPNCGRSS